MDKAELIDLLTDAPCPLDCTESIPCRKCRAVHNLEAEVACGGEEEASEIEWEDNTYRRVIPVEERNEMAELCLKDVLNFDLEDNYYVSGDTVSLVVWEGENLYTVYDAQIRRVGRFRQ